MGARLGVIGPGKDDMIVNPTVPGGNDGWRMRDYAKGGISLEADVGYHFSPSWTLYGFWEHGFLGKGELNSASSRRTLIIEGSITRRSLNDTR